MNKIKPWILAARPKTLFAAISPIIIGLSISFSVYERVNWLIALLTVISAILIQIGPNYANDAYDYLKGADNKKTRKGPLRMAEDGQLSPNAILNMMYFIFLISVSIGFYLALVGDFVCYYRTKDGLFVLLPPESEHFGMFLSPEGRDLFFWRQRKKKNTGSTSMGS